MGKFSSASCNDRWLTFTCSSVLCINVLPNGDSTQYSCFVASSLWHCIKCSWMLKPLKKGCLLSIKQFLTSDNFWHFFQSLTQQFSVVNCNCTGNAKNASHEIEKAEIYEQWYPASWSSWHQLNGQLLEKNTESSLEALCVNIWLYCFPSEIFSWQGSSATKTLPLPVDNTVSYTGCWLTTWLWLVTYKVSKFAVRFWSILVCFHLFFHLILCSCSCLICVLLQSGNTLKTEKKEIVTACNL